MHSQPLTQDMCIISGPLNLEGQLKMRDFVQTDFWKYTDTPHSPDQMGGGLQACLGQEAPVKWSLGSEHLHPMFC